MDLRGENQNLLMLPAVQVSDDIALFAGAANHRRFADQELGIDSARAPLPKRIAGKEFRFAFTERPRNALASSGHKAAAIDEELVGQRRQVETFFHSHQKFPLWTTRLEKLFPARQVWRDNLGPLPCGADERPIFFRGHPAGGDHDKEMFAEGIRRERRHVADEVPLFQ